MQSSLFYADLRQPFVPAMKLDAAGDTPAMTWSVHSPPASVEVGVSVTKYGQRFVWTEHHKTAAELQPLRQRGDPLMDAALPEKPGKDALASIEQAAVADPDGAAARLLEHAMHPPDWVDWERVARGQAVYRRYLPLAGVVLYNMSLVGGFSAPLISKVWPPQQQPASHDGRNGFSSPPRSHSRLACTHPPARPPPPPPVPFLHAFLRSSRALAT